MPRNGRGVTTIPRNGSGVYSKPAGTTAVPNTTIESAKFNQVVDDLVQDANFPRPPTAGGTGGNSKQNGIDTLFDGVTVISDTSLRVADPADRTKIVRLDAGLVATGTVRVLTAPDRDINLSSVPRGHIYGLTLSNNVTDATNDIDIAAGEAASDDATPHMMVLASVLTKRLDAAWTVGSGNGGRDTGSIADGTWHVWLIQRSDTGVVDVLFSLSATSPTMPANYDRKAYLWPIIRSGGNIVLFKQVGNGFWRETPVDDRNSTSTSASALLTLSVPTGVNVRPILRSYVNTSASSSVTNSIGSPPVSSSANISFQSAFNTSSSSLVSDITTNKSAQVYWATSIGAGTIATNTLTTFGWYFDREVQQ